jgi:hypothetical protein
MISGVGADGIYPSVSFMPLRVLSPCCEIIGIQESLEMLSESRQMGRGGEGRRPEAGIMMPAHRRQRCVKKFTDAPEDAC